MAKKKETVKIEKEPVEKVEELKFKVYTGTKIIKAAPMNKVDAEKYLGKELKNQYGTDEGYIVKYEGSYESWSPAEPFEKAYTDFTTYEGELKVERDELKLKIKKIVSALSDSQVPEDQVTLLQKQLAAMNNYVSVLNERLK